MSQPLPGSSATASSSPASSSAAQGPRAACSAMHAGERAPVEGVEAVEQGVHVAARPEELPGDVPALVLDDQLAVVARPQIARVETGERVAEEVVREPVDDGIEPRGAVAGLPAGLRV